MTGGDVSSEAILEIYKSQDRLKIRPLFPSKNAILATTTGRLLYLVFPFLFATFALPTMQDPELVLAAGVEQYRRNWR